MAKIFPNLNNCLAKMTSGEKKLAQAFNQLLEDDYLCWYDIPLGPKNRHPDFVVLNPRRGLLLLEVKDWKLDTIKTIDKSRVTLVTNDGLVTNANPLEQARQYTQALVDQLKKDIVLTKKEGRFQGSLNFAWGYGVVLSNITRQQFDQTDLKEVLNPNKVICKDELSVEQDAEIFQKRLWDMFTVNFHYVMSVPEIDRVRWHLFPEIRIDQQMSLFVEAQTSHDLSEAIPDIIRVMDLQQEQVARNLGVGHRVIHGVAGSGKTMILAYRCLQLAKHADKPILILCYNRALAEYLRNIIKAKGIEQNVEISHFDKWTKNQADTYQLAVTYARPFEKYQANLVNAITDGLETQQVPSGQYSAILIDEGNDFEPDWFRLIVQMVDPATKSLLILYDDAQNIYQRKKFAFSSVGIQARGRTTILRLNYRNTTEILDFARGFIHKWISPQEAEEDNSPLLDAESIGRHGVKPTYIFCSSDKEERAQVASFFRTQYKKQSTWKNFAILFRSNLECETFVDFLNSTPTLGIPVTLVVPKKDQFDLDKDTIKVMTIHASKGLEFDSVALPNVNYDTQRAGIIEEEAKLLYVGMTRAMNHLLVTCKEPSDFSQHLQELAKNS